MGSPERTHSQVEKDQHNERGDQKRSVIGAMQNTGPVSPQVRSENHNGQQKKDTRDFEPEDAAYAAEGAEKACQAPAHIAPSFDGLCGILSACTILRVAPGGRLALRAA
jgi:hypothetical protein